MNKTIETTTTPGADANGKDKSKSTTMLLGLGLVLFLAGFVVFLILWIVEMNKRKLLQESIDACCLLPDAGGIEACKDPDADAYYRKYRRAPAKKRALEED